MLCTCSHPLFQHSNRQRCEFCDCLAYASAVVDEKSKPAALGSSGTAAWLRRKLGRALRGESWTEALWRQRNASSPLVRLAVSVVLIVGVLLGPLLLVGPAWLLNLWLLDHGIDLKGVILRFGDVVGSFVGALIGIALWLGLGLGVGFALLYGAILALQFLYVALRRGP